MKKLIRGIFISSYLLMNVAFADGAGLPPGVTLTKLYDIQWQTSPSGREYANILGKTSAPGPYLSLVKWAPNLKALPHKHPDDRYGVVLSGVHYIGYGDQFDESQLHAHTPGTFFTEPANTSHFGMTKNEGAVLYFYGTGPSAILPVN